MGRVGGLGFPVLGDRNESPTFERVLGETAPGEDGYERSVTLTEGAIRRRVWMSWALAIGLLLPRLGSAPRAIGPPQPNCHGPVVAVKGGLRCALAASTSSAHRVEGRRALWMGRRLDLNRTPAETLTLVPGIGAKLADRIVADRIERGPFREVGDVQRVRGIGPRLTNRIEAYAEVRPAHVLE